MFEHEIMAQVSHSREWSHEKWTQSYIPNCEIELWKKDLEKHEKDSVKSKQNSRMSAINSGQDRNSLSFK